MNVLVIQHAETEGTGSLGEFLRSKNVSLRTARLYEDDILPDDHRAFDLMVSMGGPMNVYEERKYPFLREEKEFLRAAVEADVPVLGICLGAQLIACACGAAVTKAAAKEIGWSEVALTDAGKKNPLFGGLPPRLAVFQWHEDMFDVPEGGELLASSPECPNQAFQYRRAAGFQFHVEITPRLIQDWFPNPAERGPLLEGFQSRQGPFEEQAQKMYNNLVRILSFPPVTQAG